MPGKSRKCSIKVHFYSQGLLLESNLPSYTSEGKFTDRPVFAFSFQPPSALHCPLIGLIRGGMLLEYHPLKKARWYFTSPFWREVEIRLLNPGPVLIAWSSANKKMSSHSIVLWCLSPQSQGIGVHWMIKDTDGNEKVLISATWKRPGAPECLVPCTSLWEMLSTIWDSCTLQCQKIPRTS